MALSNTYAELALKNAPKQGVILDTITEDAPIFSSMPTMVASTEVQNVYQRLKAVTGGNMRAIDAPANMTSADFDLARTDLSIIDGRIEVGADTVEILGGKTAAFGTQAPVIIRETMQNVEAGIIYDNLRAFAIANGNYSSAGGSANTNYSILCVTYGQGENIGLTSPSMMNSGKIFSFSDRMGGNAYDKTLDNGDTIEVYGQQFKTLFGLQLNNENKLSAICNVDIANSKVPSLEQLDDMVLNARASGNSAIYMHPRVKQLLGREYKYSKMQLFNESTGLTKMVDTYEGVPIVTSWNFLNGTETNVA